MMEVAPIVTCRSCGAKNRVDASRASVSRPVCGKCGKALAASEDGPAGRAFDVTDATLEHVLRDAGDVPVLVDCWAAWCAPCRMLAPTLDALASESAGRYRIAKLDVDANPLTAARFQISGIPAMLIFRNGQMVDQLVGLLPRDQILKRLLRN